MIDALIGTELLKKLQSEAMKEKDQPKRKEDGSEKRTE